MQDWWGVYRPNSVVDPHSVPEASEPDDVLRICRGEGFTGLTDPILTGRCALLPKMWFNDIGFRLVRVAR